MIKEVRRHINLRHMKQIDTSVVNQIFYADFFLDRVSGKVYSVAEAIAQIPKDLF